ncbi:MAG: S41 family peptidase [Vulcanimicrobiota bacterium]
MFYSYYSGKRIIALFICMFVFVFQEGLAETGSSVPGAFRGYINNIRKPTDYKNIPEITSYFCPHTITSEQAEEDIEMVKYLFENAYSGREYWGNQGIDFDSMYKELKSLAGKNDKVEVEDIEKVITESLKDINDGHLVMLGKARHRFYEHKDAFFSDLLLEKKQGKFVVIRSNIRDVPVGSIYYGPSSNLFLTLSPEDKNHYLLGVLSYDYKVFEKFKFNNTYVFVPLHPCRLSKFQQWSKNVYYQQKYNGVQIVTVTSFLNKHRDELIKFLDFARTLRKTPYIILNVCNNHGGNSDFAKLFFIYLNDTAQWMKHSAELDSPAVLQTFLKEDLNSLPVGIKKYYEFKLKCLRQMRRNPVRKWRIANIPLERSYGSYNGRAVVLINRNVMSSGESTVSFARSVKDSVIVGENTAGIGTFGDIREYGLKHSKIRFIMPYKLFINRDCKEGEGFYPDYWLDSSRPLDEITRWLKQPDTYQFEPEFTVF